MLALIKSSLGLDRARAAPLLSAEWRSLVMLNYEVDPLLLARYTPAGTEIDTFAGRALVSLVGFEFLAARFNGWSAPGLRDFPEVNLRFYARRRIENQWRRGVVFIQEIAPRWLAAQIARRVYHENYVCRAMRRAVKMPDATSGAPGEVCYEWRSRRMWNRLSVSARGESRETAEGSEERFVAEHYWCYTAQSNGTTKEYRVEHPPWRIWPASSVEFECDVADVYRPEWSETLRAAPTSAFLVDGSAVVVHPGRRIDAGPQRVGDPFTARSRRRPRSAWLRSV